MSGQLRAGGPVDVRRAAGVPRRPRPRMRVGAHEALVPLERSHYDLLWELAASRPTQWRWRGKPVSQELFGETLWSGVLMQLLIERSDGWPVGLVALLDVDIMEGHGHVHLMRFDDRGADSCREGVELFVDLVFERYGALRKLYADVFGEIDPALGSVFELEAVLKDHRRSVGGAGDLRIFSVTHAGWVGARSTAGSPGAGSDRAT